MAGEKCKVLGMADSATLKRVNKLRAEKPEEYNRNELKRFEFARRREERAKKMRFRRG